MIVLLGLLMGACIDIPEIQHVVEDADAGYVEPGDASTPDAGGHSLQVGLVTSRRVTNGSVDVRIELTGPVPELVELLVDGERVATMLPPYRTQWNTQVLAEGQHELHARATLGSRVFLSVPHQLTVDRTLPTWLTRSPSTGSRFVAVGQVAQALFSESLDPTTVHSNSVRMFAGAEAITATVSLSTDGTAVAVSPLSSLPLDVPVKVTFTDSVTDLAGNSISPGEQEWSWTVPGYLPLGAPLLTDVPTSMLPYRVELQIGKAGQPVVAWADSSRFAVFVRRWTGETWELLGPPLKSGSADAAPGLTALRLDENDQPVVAWVEPAEHFVFVRRWNGATWEEMGAAVPSPLNVWGLSLRTDGSGKWFLSFMAGNNAGSRFLIWEWEEDHWVQLGAALKVDTNASLTGGFMGFDGTGNPLAMWSERTSGGATTVHMRRWSSGNWVPLSHSFSTLDGIWGSDAKGRLLCAFPQGSGVWVWGWDDTAWGKVGTPMDELFPGAPHAELGGFASDPTGALVALLREPESSGQPEALYARRLREGNWERVGGLLRLQPDQSPSTYPAFAIAPTGRFLVARGEYSEGTPNVRPIRVYISNE
ncbi:Ig-like domain-containing protein [Corallococcus terminator]